ncbi:MFS transporter [Bifidobacterium asteroides]|uniref:MFS transporter n=1 Tax=Bifidobacterium asteroides TaxID=1684 RepID=A0A318MK96_9BIFI|nr:MFS transporter [Bifidobacterium asteroides]PXY88026.1 MFS transporter [Bifidobacterium asteroides]
MDNLLKNRNNRLYLSSVVTDNFGSSLMMFALPLMVLDITGSGIHLSFISAIETIPFLILGLPIGAIIDRLDVKKIIVFSDLIRLLSYSVLALALALKIPSAFMIFVIYIVSLAVSVMNILSTVSEITFVSFLVKKEDFSKLNSTVYGIQYGVNFALPILGGVLYKYFPHSLLTAICAVFYLISLLLVNNIILVSQSDPSARLSSVKYSINVVFTDIKDGVRYTAKIRAVLYPLVLAALVNMASANFQNDSLIVLRQQIGLSSDQIGLILSIAAVSALIGTVVVNWLNKKIEFGKLLVLSIIAGSLFRTVFALSTNLVILVSSIACIAINESILNISIITNRQNEVGQEYLGRVTSIYKAVLIGVNSIGYLLGGFVANKIGSRLGIGISAVELFVVSIVGILLMTFVRVHND